MLSASRHGSNAWPNSVFHTLRNSVAVREKRRDTFWSEVVAVLHGSTPASHVSDQLGLLASSDVDQSVRTGKADRIRDIFIYLTGAKCIIFADRRLFHQSHENGSCLTAPHIPPPACFMAQILLGSLVSLAVSEYGKRCFNGPTEGIKGTCEVMTGDHFGLV